MPGLCIPVVLPEGGLCLRQPSYQYKPQVLLPLASYQMETRRKVYSKKKRKSWCHADRGIIIIDCSIFQAAGDYPYH